MKNTFKLYKATLKKLLIPAVIMGVLLIISTVLFINGRARAVQDYEYYGYYGYYGIGSFFRGKPTAFAMAPGLPIFMIVGAAVLTFTAFSYLNKRNASDFYQSLPYTRTENIVSRFLAVMTYQIGIVVLTLLVSLLVLKANGISANASFFPLLIGGYTAGSLLVAGAVMLAMSITGTAISNTLVAGLILFLPRMLLFIMGQSAINMTNWRVLLGHTGIFLNPVYNIVTGSLLDISGLWEYYGLSETLINPGSIIYTAVLGAVYVLLALWLLKKRKSEMAGYGAAKPIIACAFGALASLPFLLFGVSNYQSGDLGTAGYASSMTLLIILAIALVVYIVVSFALSTQWKTVLKALPLFATVIVVAVGVVIGANITAVHLGTEIPDRDNIAYVRVNEQGDWEYRYNSTNNYNAILASRVEFTDDQVVDLFYQALDENNQTWMMQRNDIYETGYAESTRVLCEFKLKSGRSIFRVITIYVKDIADFRSAMMGNQEYMDAYTALAEGADIYYYSDEDEELYQSVWEMYKTEFNSLSDKEKLNQNLNNLYAGIIGYNQSDYNQSSRYVLTSSVFGEIDDTAYMQFISVSDETPITANFYMNAVNAKVAGKLPEALRSAMNPPDGTFFDFSIIWYDEIGSGTWMYYSSDMPEGDRAMSYDSLTNDQMEELISLVSEKNLSEVSVNEPYMLLQFGVYGNYEGQSESYEAYIPLTNADLEMLKAFYTGNQTVE